MTCKSCDLSALSEAEILDILVEPARQAMVSNPAFRRRCDDNQRLTYKWLLTAGFHRVNRGVATAEMCLLREGYERHGWKWFGKIDETVSLNFPPLKTRRHLRIICELLGVQLKDET